MAASLGKLSVEFGGDYRDLDRSQRAVDRSLKQTGRSFDDLERKARQVAVTMGKTLATAAAALAVSLGVAFRAGIQSASELVRTSEQLGIPIEKLGELRFAAEQSSVKFETLTEAVNKLNVQMAAIARGEVSQASAAFEALGIAVQGADGSLRPVAEVLGDVATKLATFRDGTNKSAIAVALFGEQGSKLLPLLNKGADGIEKMGAEARKVGLVLDEETTRKAAAAGKEIERIGNDFSALGQKLAAEALPALTAFREIIEDPGIVAAISLIGKAIEALQSIAGSSDAAISGYAATIERLSKALFDLRGQLEDGIANGADVSGIQSEITETVAAIEKASRALEDANEKRAAFNSPKTAAVEDIEATAKSAKAAREEIGRLKAARREAKADGSSVLEIDRKIATEARGAIAGVTEQIKALAVERKGAFEARQSTSGLDSQIAELGSQLLDFNRVLDRTGQAVAKIGARGSIAGLDTEIATTREALVSANAELDRFNALKTDALTKGQDTSNLTASIRDTTGAVFELNKHLANTLARRSELGDGTSARGSWDDQLFKSKTMVEALKVEVKSLAEVRDRTLGQPVDTARFDESIEFIKGKIEETQRSLSKLFVPDNLSVGKSSLVAVNDLIEELMAAFDDLLKAKARALTQGNDTSSIDGALGDVASELVRLRAQFDGLDTAASAHLTIDSSEAVKGIEAARSEVVALQAELVRLSQTEVRPKLGLSVEIESTNVKLIEAQRRLTAFYSTFATPLSDQATGGLVTQLKVATRELERLDVAKAEALERGADTSAIEASIAGVTGDLAQLRARMDEVTRTPIRFADPEQVANAQLGLKLLQKELLEVQARKVEALGRGVDTSPFDASIEHIKGQIATLDAGMQAILDKKAALIGEFTTTVNPAEPDRPDAPGYSRVDQINETSATQERLNYLVERDNELRAEGKQIMDEMRTPHEEAAARIERINELYRAGAIDAQTYGRASERAALILATTYADVASNIGNALGSIFEDNKGVAIASAVINTAQSITKTLATYGFTPFGISAAAAAAAAGYAQIRAIRSTSRNGGGSSSAPSPGGGSGGGGSGGNGGDGGSGGGGRNSTLYVQGIDRNGFFTGESVRALAEQLLSYQRDGGKVILADA